MTLHALLEYLKYKRKAKGRHGVHSPFVYDFIEKVLRDRSSTSFKDKVDTYFQNENLKWLRSKDRLPASSNCVVIVAGIHKTANDTKCWNEKLSQPTVTLSIDLYEYGLLFFKPEFKEKQHFILKYPA